MRYALHNPTRRPGFTLVEILVAAGLAMLIMAVLATAFSAGVDTLSHLKSTGELAERLATAQSILTRDLQAQHLIDDDGQPLKVSDVRLDKIHDPSFRDDGLNGKYAKPPAGGYFRIEQDQVSWSEGTDPDGIISTRSPDSMAPTRTHRLFLTSKLPKEDDLSLIPQDWTEVLYFLARPVSNPTTTGGQPLFVLHRQLNRNVVPTTVDNKASRATPTPDIDGGTILLSNVLSFEVKADWEPGAVVMNDNKAAANDRFVRAMNTTPQANTLFVRASGEDEYCVEASNPQLIPMAASDWSHPEPVLVPRPTMAPFAALLPRGVSRGITHDDLPLLPWIRDGREFTDPVSSDRFAYGAVTDVPHWRSDPSGGTYTVPTGSQRVFDTWHTTNADWNQPVTIMGGTVNRNVNYPPLPIRLKAIQIKIRIYDPKNNITRQVTIVQTL